MEHTHFIYKCMFLSTGWTLQDMAGITRHYSTKHSMYNASYLFSDTFNCYNS